MGQYIIRRLLQAIPLLIIVGILVFFLIQVSGDPTAELAANPRYSEADIALERARLGLNEPLFPHRFVTWLIGDDWRRRDYTGDGVVDGYGEQRGILRGDFGESYHFKDPVIEVVSERLPNTILLGTTAYIVTIVFSLVVGLYAALRPYTFADNLLTGFSFFTFSMPIFLIALLLVQIFAVSLDLLPVQGMCPARGACTAIERVRHMILPVLSLALISTAGYSRFIRTAMLEVINSDYVRTARAKGLGERRVADPRRRGCHGNDFWLERHGQPVHPEPELQRLACHRLLRADGLGRGDHFSIIDRRCLRLARSASPV
jgi:peptide/nickel transport system permease protein